jgi:hypothetical protein
VTGRGRGEVQGRRRFSGPAEGPAQDAQAPAHLRGRRLCAVVGLHSEYDVAAHRACEEHGLLAHKRHVAALRGAAAMGGGRDEGEGQTEVAGREDTSLRRAAPA